MVDTDKKLTGKRAGDLLELLRARHVNDVFVGECHMGPSGSRRLDAWAMPRSWAPWTTIGYEIKVSRQDFLHDNKWAEYLSVCHQLYFVCPNGLISAEELPQDVGLIWSTKQGSRLLTKRKAARREIDEHKIIKLLTYVLMSRTNIVGNMYEVGTFNSYPARSPERLEAMRKHVQDAELRKTLANEVNAHVRAQFKAMEKHVIAADRREKNVDAVVQALAKLGVVLDADHGFTVPRVVNEVKLLLGMLDDGLLHDLDRFAKDMTTFVTNMYKLRKGN